MSPVFLVFVTSVRDSCHKVGILVKIVYNWDDFGGKRKMKKFMAITFIVLVLSAVVIAYFAVGQQRAEAATSSYQVVQASRGSLTATVGATGVVRANQTAQMLWRTSGVVEQVLAKAGDSVAAGDPLVRLVETSLPQNVILARSELTQAQKALDDLYETQVSAAQAYQAVIQARKTLLDAEQGLVRFDEKKYKDDLERARKDSLDAEDRLKQAESDFEPYQDWDEESATRKSYLEKVEDAQRKYDDAVRKLDLLQLEKEAAQANLDLARANLEQAENTYEKLKNGPAPDDIAAAEARVDAAQATLDLARVEAPFDGILTQVNVRPGDQATAGQPSFRLDDLSRLLVDVRVSEVDINRLKLDQPVNLTFDAIPGQEYRGLVVELAEIGSATQGLVEFLVTVELEDPDENVKPGMTAAVNVVVERLENVLLTPNRAVRSQDGQRVVYVLRNGSLVSVPVVLGASSDTMSEVVSGELQAGDQIVLNPPQTFNGGGGGFFRR
jgi:HlyD family secretion protein